MTQANMLKILYKMGVTDKLETAVCRKDISKEVDEFPLTPTNTRALRNLSRSGEIIHTMRGNELISYYYFNTRIYNALRTHLGIVDTKE